MVVAGGVLFGKLQPRFLNVDREDVASTERLGDGHAQQSDWSGSEDCVRVQRELVSVSIETNGEPLKCD